MTCSSSVANAAAEAAGPRTWSAEAVAPLRVLALLLQRCYLRSPLGQLILRLLYADYLLAEQRQDAILTLTQELYTLLSERLDTLALLHRGFGVRHRDLQLSQHSGRV